MGFGVVFIRDTAQFPLLMGGNALTIHQNPMERVLLRCYDPAVRVPDGMEAGFFLAVSLPRRGTATNKDRKVNEGSVVE
jgi:hypothetical protein